MGKRIRDFQKPEVVLSIGWRRILIRIKGLPCESRKVKRLWRNGEERAFTET